MSLHRAKTAALLAYEADVLSAVGRRRVDAHLAACAVCRRELAAIRAYEVLAAEARAIDTPAVDWDTMDLALRREARVAAREASDARRVGPAAALAVAAAVLLGVVSYSLSAGPAPEPEASRGVRHLDAIEPARSEAPGEITLAAGDVTGEGGVSLGVGATLAEGSRLATGDDSEVHVRFADDTGAALLANGALRLGRAREGEHVLDLERGTVANAVAHLDAEEVYDVFADPYTIVVRGTRFAVTRDGDAVEVVVDEGVVEVRRGASLEAVVRAPGRWSSVLRALGPDVVAAVHGLDRLALRWPRLRYTAGDGVDRLVVGGVSVPAHGILEMRVPEGEVTMVGLGVEGQELYRRIVPVAADGAAFEGEALAPSAPRARSGVLAPELIAPTVRAGMRRMQACHDQIARISDAPSGRYTLRITIGLTGEVRRAELVTGERTAEPPDAFRACILAQARSWTFPAPTGGTVTFEQPLRFATRMR